MRIDYTDAKSIKARDTSYQKTETVSKRWRARFDSLPELERWMEQTPKLWTYGSSTDEGRGHNWDLGAGWSGAQDMARRGWPEGAAKVHDLGLEVMARPSSGRAPKWGYDVAGDLPDVGRFMSGRPDNMRRRRSHTGRSPIVTICINQSVSGGTEARSMLNYGVAMLALIDRIEHAGRRVELFVGFASLLNSGRTALHGSICTRIKGADEPVDMGALAYALAHPAFFRRHGFAVIERMPKDYQTPGYGRCANWISDGNDLLDGPPDALMIDGLGHGNASRCSTLDGALKLAKEQINLAWLRHQGKDAGALVEITEETTAA